jgi:ectoine hydroxylase-related dioxygenase (phytanoyl-CoA dioxygenase family)
MPEDKTQPIVTPNDVAAFQADGAVCIRGLFAGWTDRIAEAIEANLAEPGTYAAESATGENAGRFFDDYCNWERLPAMRRVVEQSPAAEAAAALMHSRSAQFFHDHVLVKEPGTPKATPWHQDSPYYFVDGEQTVSFWIPVEPVTEATLRLVAGSHRWPRLVRPVRWLDDSAFYGSEDDYLPVPDPDSDPAMRVLEWDLQPGDAVAFDFRTVHGARGNLATRRRRVLSLRWVGDDARYVERPGRTSPPYPGHAMQPGQRLREDWFPVVWQAA